MSIILHRSSFESYIQVFFSFFWFYFYWLLFWVSSMSFSSFLLFFLRWTLIYLYVDFFIYLHIMVFILFPKAENLYILSNLRKDQLLLLQMVSLFHLLHFLLGINLRRLSDLLILCFIIFNFLFEHSISLYIWVGKICKL